MSGPDRRLGDAWSGWKDSPDPDDRDARSHRDARSPKRLFLSAVFLSLLLAGLGLAAGLYFLEPRLRQWGPEWPRILAWTLGLAWGASLVLFLLLAAGVASKSWASLLRGLPRRLPQFFFRPAVRAIARRLGATPDRLAHSFIRVHNAWQARPSRPVPAGRILVLLPRCLSAGQMERMTRICAESGVRSAVVSGGEAARRTVDQAGPQAVVGVACERDLLSGIRDLCPRIRTVGIPNTRPEGPCRNTLADADELQRTLRGLIAGSRLAGSA
jgi:hypothetical protein